MKKDSIALKVVSHSMHKTVSHIRQEQEIKAYSPKEFVRRLEQLSLKNGEFTFDSVFHRKMTPRSLFLRDQLDDQITFLQRYKLKPSTTTAAAAAQAVTVQKEEKKAVAFSTDQVLPVDKRLIIERI
jgi:hypothetical protein